MVRYSCALETVRAASDEGTASFAFLAAGGKNSVFLAASSKERPQVVNCKHHWKPSRSLAHRLAPRPALSSRAASDRCGRFMSEDFAWQASPGGGARGLPFAQGKFTPPRVPPQFPDSYCVHRDLSLAEAADADQREVRGRQARRRRQRQGRWRGSGGPPPRFAARQFFARWHPSVASACDLWLGWF